MKRNAIFFFLAITCLVFFGCDSPTKNNNNTPEPTNYDVMVPVEGGTFLMGNPDSTASALERPQHWVTVSDFYIGKYEVTQRIYYETMGITPPEDAGDLDRAMQDISWIQCRNFCNQKSLNEGLTPCYSGESSNLHCDYGANGYRMPTEAEWEFAARGGNLSQGFTYPGSYNPEEVAQDAHSNANKTCVVGLLLPNELGLYDMAGNAQEWCSDWYKPEYYQDCLSLGTVVDPHGPDEPCNGSGMVNYQRRSIRAYGVSSDCVHDPHSYSCFYRNGFNQAMMVNGCSGLRFARKGD